MKKINFLFIALFAVVSVFIASCDGETDDLAAPSITFTLGSQTVLPNTAVTIEADIYAAGSIGSIQMKKDGVDYGTAITEGFGSDTATTLTFTVPAEQVTADFTLQIEVTDLQKTPKSQLSSVVYITLDDLIFKHAGLKIYSAQAGIYGNGDYASLTTFETWNHSQASADAAKVALIDVWYYNGSYTKDLGGTPHLVSPATKTTTYNTHDGLILTNAKITYLKILVDTELALFSDWAGISDDTELKALTGISSTNVGGFAQNAVIAFKLADGKLGVMKAVGGTTGSGSTDYILVDVIIQKFAPVK